MTLFETVLLAAGISLLAWFMIRSAFPSAKSLVDAAADRRSRDLREEFLRLTTRQAKLLLIGAGSILSLVVFVLSRNALWAIPAAAVPILLSGIAVRSYSARRRRRVLAQLPAFIDLLCGHVKAGHSLPESLSRVQEALPHGIREEVAWIVRANRLGTPLSQCLFQWEDRIAAEEISLVARPLATALPTGGNVVELLTRTRDILRMRARSKERLKSMTAQARLQAAVLTLLPPGFAAAISAVDPEYLPRILGTPQGKTILALAGFLQVAGWVVIRKILAEKT